MEQEMLVKKRDGKMETVSFDKILKRVKTLGLSQNISINYTTLVIKVIDQLYNKIDTARIDELTAEQAASMSTLHPDYSILASALVISNLHKKTNNSFSKSMNKIYNFTDINNKHTPLLSKEFIDIVNEYADFFDNLVNSNRDYIIDYFGFKTLERAYLIHTNGIIIERPQYMWLRTAICIHKDDLDAVKETYDLMSQKYFTHATPTLFNAGTPRPQLSSCFLIAMENDSVEGIYNTLKECANISKWAGGIGLHIHNIRAKGSLIRGTNGTSNGIVPMLKVFNNTARYIDQCITPETYIYTTRGSIQIQHITNNDYIFNSTGNIEQIENILEHPYDGEIYSIETMHSIEPLKVTGEHPILVLVNQPRGTNYSTIEKRLKHYEAKLSPTTNFLEISESIEISPTINQLIQWKDVKDLTLDDMFIYTIPQYVNDITYISSDDCYMYGIILGDGYYDNKSSTGYISLHTINKNFILEFCKEYFEKKCISYSINISDNITRIRWNKNIIMPFRYSDIYDMEHEKNIAERWLNLPIEKTKYIIKGLIDTDGCKHKELLFDSTSRNLIEGMRYLLLRMGIPTSGYIRDRRGEKHQTERGVIENKKISYTLRIPQTEEICNLVGIENNSKFFKYLTYKNLIITRIKSISTMKYCGTLYDLQMKNKHEYMIHNGIIHNGGGRRNGSFAIYIEPHHADIEEYLDLKKNHGDEELRARDLFYALWVSDLFMERVKSKSNSKWSLFCPDSAPGLSECYGEDYKLLYEKYENEGKFIRQINARDLWIKILDSQMETGTPYILYKDAANIKSNQKNLGTIMSSNLCSEIIEYSNANETAVCNLASIALSKFIMETDNPFSDNIEVYTKDNCNWCILLKALLKRKNINFNEINLETEEESTLFKQKWEVTTVPQLIDNNVLIGGFTKILGLLRNQFDYELLHKVTKIITKNLNNIIDTNFYPTKKTKRSNLYHRPIGIGIQGLADVFILMDIPYHSEEAKEINKNIFETIYHGALEKSMELSYDRNTDINILRNLYMKSWYFKDNDDDLCQEYIINDFMNASSSSTTLTEYRISELLKKHKPIRKEIERKISENTYGSYSSFEGSPASNGILQFDMWNISPGNRYDWDDLKNKIQTNGLRNSLLVAPMPTASTSQILGNNECFEPLTSNIYSRRTLAGEFILANKYLIKELLELGIWNEDIKNNIILNKGSIQYIESIPQFIKEKYKIVWEIPMKHLIDMATDRGAFICQSQSLNLWLEDPDAKALTNMHFYSWNNGLKTGIYYLRRKPKHQPQQFTIEPEQKNKSGLEQKNKSGLEQELEQELDSTETKKPTMVCTEDACDMCGA